jgi:mRNA interferase RelE/StbE
LKYQLFYHPHCLKRLKKIPTVDRERILNKLQQLSVNPSSRSLDIKKLATTKNSFRLRVGDLRAIYEPDEKRKIIYVWEIDYRGKVY